MLSAVADNNQSGVKPVQIQINFQGSIMDTQFPAIAAVITMLLPCYM